ncbi:hypothetical protein TNCV_1735771 [Trichonephila clavipes]|nr:hypothetical protein TNCV_1735771 [Trichonephila clavipes]
MPLETCRVGELMHRKAVVALSPMRCWLKIWVASSPPISFENGVHILVSTSSSDHASKLRGVIDCGEGTFELDRNRQLEAFRNSHVPAVA